MYVVPLLILLALALIATAWAPIFAVLIAIPVIVAFLLWRGFARTKSSEEHEAAAEEAERTADRADQATPEAVRPVPRESTPSAPSARGGR